MSQDTANLMTPAEPLLFEYTRYSPDQSQSKMLMNHKNIDQLLDDDFLNSTRQILMDGIAIEALKGLPDKNEISECSPEKLRETIKKIFCEYIETTLYQNLESQLLKKEFPSTFDQVIRNFSHGFGGRILAECVQGEPAIKSSQTNISVFFNTHAYIDDTYEENGKAYRQMTTHSCYIKHTTIRVNQYKEKFISLSGKLSVAYNLDDLNYTLDGNRALVALVSTEHSKHDRESLTYWENFARQAAKTSLVEFIIDRKTFIEKSNQGTYNITLKNLVENAVTYQIQFAEIFHKLDPQFFFVDEKSELRSMFFDTSHSLGYKESDEWQKSKMSQINLLEKKLGNTEQKPPVSSSQPLTKNPLYTKDFSKQMMHLYGKHIQVLSEEKPHDSNFADIEDQLFAIQRLNEKNKSTKPEEIPWSIQEAEFLMDTIEKDYKKDRPHSTYIEILKRLGYSYNTTASLVEKEKISTLFKKVEKSFLTTSPVSLSSHHGFFEKNNLPSKHLPIRQAEIRHIPSKKTEKMTNNGTNFLQHNSQRL